MTWWKRKPRTRQVGSVLFRGRWVALPEHFGFLEKHGIQFADVERGPEGGWTAALEHRAWGRATLVAQPDLKPPPRFIVDIDPRLSDCEKAAVASCGWAVGLLAEPQSGNVLADRKDLLRFLYAALGDDGIAAVDHSANALWSRAGLSEELAHDADLDIDAIYTMHLLYPNSETPAQARRVYWLHSHGLREIGFCDFDVLDPAEGLLGGHAHDVLRALAFSLVEGRLKPGNAPFEVVGGEWVRAVPAREFLQRAPSSEHAAYRASVDDEHVDHHVVTCDPAGGGWISRLFRRKAPRPSRFLQGPLPEEALIHFSSSATALMADRARRMMPVFQELATELAPFNFPALVKLGYPVDGGGEDDREHLWFQVHDFQGQAVDATLVNAPFHVARLKEGDRAMHSLELLSDWTIFTPFGRVDPRQTRTLRFIRENRERLREVLAAAKGTTAAPQANGEF